MPPKRRKATKKKKHTTSISPSSSPPTSLTGNDDLKSHDERESDAGEISCDTDQNYCEQHSLVEEREGEEGGSLSVPFVDFAGHNQMEESSNGKIEDTQKVETGVVEKEVVIEGVDEELKLDEELLRETVVEVNSVFMNNTRDGDYSSSSSSSSDDEAKPKEKSPEAVNLENLEVEKEILEEEKVIFYSVIDPVVPFSEESTQIAETTLENSGASDVIEYESKENGVKILPSPEENNGFSPVVTEVLSKGIEQKILPASDETKGQASGIEDLYNMKQPDENTGDLSGIVDLVSKGKVENLMLQQADMAGVETSNADEQHINEPEIPESIENTPIIPATPPVLQPTSWRSCCGLFDVLRRSNG